MNNHENQRPAALGQSFLKPLAQKISEAYKLVAPEQAELLAQFEEMIGVVDIDDRSDSFGAIPAWSIITGAWWALECLWCCAYAISVYAPLFETKIMSNDRVIDPMHRPGTLIANGLLLWSQDVLKSGTRRVWLHSNVRWPYTPSGEFPYDDDDGQLQKAEAVFLNAVGWILFHEISHLRNQHGEQDKVIDEEKQADHDATKWLFENAPFGGAHERGEGLICAHFYMWLRERLGPTPDTDHPVVFDRIEACLDDAGFHNNAWPICTLAALVEMFLQWRGVPSPGTAGATFNTCRDYLRAVLPPKI